MSSIEASHNRVVAIVQCRLGSTRFPGKMLQPLHGRPVISWTISRMRAARSVELVVLATTSLPEDDQLVNWCRSYGIECFRGSPTDVLDRFYQCAKVYRASVIVRVTGDCPLIDPGLVDDVVEALRGSPGAQYATNGEPLSYPEGMTVEALTFGALESAWKEATLPAAREHVTPFVRFAPDRFGHALLHSQVDLQHVRLTVDYPEDLAGLNLIADIASARKPFESVTLDDVVQIWNENAEIRRLLSGHQRDVWRGQFVSRQERENPSN